MKRNNPENKREKARETRTYKMTTKTTPRTPDVSEIEVKEDDVHSLVSKWMDDTMGVSDGDDDATGLERRGPAGRRDEEEEEEEVRLPRVGLGAEGKAERGAWKTHEAAAERLAPGARGVAQKLLQQNRRRLGADSRGKRGDDDDGDSRLGSIVRLSAKKKGAQKAAAKDAVTKLMEEKQKKRERKAAAKAAKEAEANATKDAPAPATAETEEKEEKESAVDAGEPAEKKARTGEAFADGEDFISLPPAENTAPAWKKKGPHSDQGEGRRKKERYVRPENVAPRTAKIRFQTTADGQTRKRTKTRSKQKNLRRDHRPLEKRPTTIPLAPQNTHKVFDDDD